MNPAGLMRKVHLSIQKRGLAGAIRSAAGYATGPLEYYSPQRVLKRWSDQSFDRRYGVDTSLGVDLNQLRVNGENVALGRRYQASSEKIFRDAIDSLPIDHQEFVFIDFGSGKGKCLLMASDYRFKKIIGVEFSEELVAIAQQNCQRYHSPKQQCRNLESVACDATTYELPDDPGVYYFYNPFQAPLMRQVRDNLRRSIERHPRTAYIVYYNALHREVFDEAPWLQLVKDSADYSIWERV